MEELKTCYFASHPDDPIIFHRKALVNKKPPFGALNAPEVANAFNRELLTMLANLNYTIITVVIDKLEHQRRSQPGALTHITTV